MKDESEEARSHEAEVDEEDKEEEKAPLPLHDMEMGIAVRMYEKYDIRRTSKDVYMCSCPGWRF